MEIYDTDEEQVAAIKRWWKENGTSIIVGLFAGGLIIGGWNLWKNNVQEKSSQASALYGQLLESINSENTESSEKIAERVIDQYGSTAYASYAALLLAKTKVQQGDLDAAISIFKKQMHEADSSELKNIARMRLIKLMLAKGESEKGLQLIAEADQSSTQAFAANYDELKGDLYVALDRLGEARTAYESALRAGLKSPLLQFKLDDISSAEIMEIKTDEGLAANKPTANANE
ncbi:MAG: YfgM family protein [Methylococcaceae bacterium]